MFKTDIASIFFYIVIGIIILVVIPIIIFWRLKDKQKEGPKNIASNDLLNAINALVKVNNVEVFYNIVVQERFRKKQYLHQPAGILSKQKFFLLSDLIKQNIEQVKIKQDIIEIKNDKGQIKKAKNIFLPEIFAFRKWIARASEEKAQEIEIIILHYGQKLIKASNNVYFVPLANIYNFIEAKNLISNKRINCLKIKKIITNKNIIKPDKKGLRKMIKYV